MADSQVSDLTELGTAVTTDVLYIIDVSDTTDGAAGSSRKATLATTIGSSTITLTNKTIDADNNTVSNLAHGSEVDNTTTSHGATGAVVGTTNSQTLTNKTLTSPTLTTAVVATSLDMNGQKLILDANANTSITADTDDQIDIEISGADDFRFTANKFEVLSGSNIDMNANELILDADGDTSITADTEDQIDIKINNADDFKFTANVFEALSGSDILIANNESYQAKQVGGTAKDLVKMNADDLLALSQINEQDGDGTDTVRENQVIQRGWGFIQGDGTAANEKTVTFADAYDDALYDLSIVLIGVKSGSDPTTRVDGATGLTASVMMVAAGTIATTGFDAKWKDTSGTNISTSLRGLFSWIAIGTIA